MNLLPAVGAQRSGITVTHGRPAGKAAMGQDRVYQPYGGGLAKNAGCLP